MILKIGLGGGCHWCTEAVFQSLKGVLRVEQGWVSSEGKDDSFSEAVIVQFDAARIQLKELIEVHLYTHQSTSDHSMRKKYRSAIYYFSQDQSAESSSILKVLQAEFDERIITQVLPFKNFEPSREEITNYYYTNPQKPFCEKYIAPKLQLLLERFSSIVKTDKIKTMRA
ncbi:peptide-methionine (S)-S-oxide reductase [Sungkyunkwania multivorans]|uniref:peptide-methionine (S)-S-oxide reductase n=1 Tax=Sungkyunkwania multivorans TaxID=1173618 RepID=A0ABW3D1H5_9FLAO